MAHTFEFVPHTTAASLILRYGNKRSVLLRGEPGIGKTSVGAEVARMATAKYGKDYRLFVIDAGNTELGDLAMPEIRQIDTSTGATTRVLSFVPNELFGTHLDTPIVLMIDELGKAPRAVMNMLLPTLNDHRIGSVPLTEGSILLATSNLTTDLVADTIPPHALDRMTTLYVRKPKAQEWIDWAVVNGISPGLIAFASQTAEAFTSYVDSANDQSMSQMVFHPTQNVTHFVTPRSLAALSPAVDDFLNGQMTYEELKPWASGSIGAAAAGKLCILLQANTQIPTKSQILADPEGEMRKIKASMGTSDSAIGALGALMASQLALTLDTLAELDAISKFIAQHPSEEVKMLYWKLVSSSNSEVARKRLSSTGFRDLSSMQFNIRQALAGLE